MLQPSVAERLKRMLPERFWNDAIVAGGYAADPERATDVDLWVIGVPEGQMTEVETEIRGHMIAKGWLSSGASTTQELIRDFQREFGGEAIHYEEHPGKFRVIVDGVSSGAGVNGILPLQIILSVQPTFLALLKSFDITTHQIGFRLTSPEVPVRAHTYTTPLDPPRVVLWDRPHQTLKRLERIAPRYGYAPHPDDVQRLMAMKDDSSWQEAA